MVEATLDPVTWLRKHLEQADTDLLREMVRTFVQALMSAEADAICGGPVRGALGGADQPAQRLPRA